MVALNFQRQFVGAVKSGRKRRTIRAMRKTGNPRPGDKLQLYTGMRTKACHKIREATCTAVTAITIDQLGITLAGRRIADADALARKDGFCGFAEMAGFFETQYGLPFAGQMIEWAYRNG